jgi:hypothetical protein
MVVGTITISELDMMSVYNTDAFKRSLASQLATALLEKRLVEFTQHQDPIQGSTTVRIRAFLVPDDNIRILRIAK